jgi:type IV pilus assembly protein PilB
MSDRQTSLPRLRTTAVETDGVGAAPFGVADSIDLLVDLIGQTKLVPPQRLAEAGERARQTGSLARALVEEGIATSSGIARHHAAQFGLPLIEFTTTLIDEAAVAAVPMRVLERVVALPYALDGDVLRIAVADPANVHAIDELRLATPHQIELAVATQDEILEQIGRMARAFTATAVPTVLDGQEVEFEESLPETDLEADDGLSEEPLVRLVNSILFQAAEDGASDIHFDPQEDALIVRFRVDGILREAQRIPRQTAAGIVTRFKVLAKLDIAERRKPQDGRISVNAAAAGRKLDVRVVTLPTVYGESVVLRLLDQSTRPPTMAELGFSEGMQAALRKIIDRPTGALLVTGPTGAGKTTTLFAVLNELSRPEINVITVEDPVEYRLPGVNQVQVNPRGGVTFATALRSILRSDPDVVMVGEIRDGETAKIAIEAALTGHFVLTTLHTNDAPSALTRLNEMGVEPFLTGASVTGVLAQRLARKLCPHCCELYTPTPEELNAARISPEVASANGGFSWYRKKGCPRCGQSGYRGRVGIFQLLSMTEDLAALAAAKASRQEIERAAIDSGMRSLWDDGLEKISAGLTSLEELARVTS